VEFAGILAIVKGAVDRGPRMWVTRGIHRTPYRTGQRRVNGRSFWKTGVWVCRSIFNVGLS